jgi:hypothetical protein
MNDRSSDDGDRTFRRGVAWLNRNLLRPARRLVSNSRVASRARTISSHFPLPVESRPVIFFRASTGILDFNYNNAFHMLAAWGLRLQRVPVIHFACQAGMSRCVLGTNPARPGNKPPCAACLRHSRALLKGSQPHWFGYRVEAALRDQLSGLSVADLESFEYHHDNDQLTSPIPLGRLVVAGLRWRLRRHHLVDDDGTRFLFREFILSAWNVAREFADLMEQTAPQAVVMFNGQFYPEATARWVAMQRGVRVITHEVGLQPFSGFFTDGAATAYPIHIPDEFQLSAEQNARLDEYLSNRFQGNFSMAGVRFWPQMKGLDEGLLDKINRFDQVVPVFTNVVFDTSQPHANTLFSDMFAWLEVVKDLAGEYPRTAFVIRAHPDETRAGKESRETVQEWVQKSSAADLPNVVFIAPQAYLSSYELIQRARFVMVYNSTIGLEATILGAPVLCAGKARFTQYPTVFLPATAEEFGKTARKFLEAERIEVPEEFRTNARRFLYYQLYRTSLPFSGFLDKSFAPSLTRFKRFGWQDLLPENAPAIRAIVDGVLHGGEFLLEETRA